ISRLECDISATKQQALSTERATQNDYLRGRAKKVAAKAKAREARLDRMLSAEHKIEKPRQSEKMRLNLKGRNLYHSLLMELRAAGLQRGNITVLDNINAELRGNQRVAVTGRNGAGKSSLLQLILGKISPMTGSVRTRSDLKLGYLPQQQDSL